MKRIDDKTRQRIKLLCYEVVLGEIIDASTRRLVVETTKKYLADEGYEVEWVKCDEENNPPTVVDCNKMIVQIFQKDFPCSHGGLIHTIEL